MKKKDPSSSPKPRKKVASTKAAAPRKRAAKRTSSAAEIATAVNAALFAPRLDYPQEGERIVSGDYTLRIDAPQDGLSIEVSIDRGDWRPCRAAVGYWWFDWSGFGPGEHSIIARAVSASGDFAVSPERRVTVEL